MKQDIEAKIKGKSSSSRVEHRGFISSILLRPLTYAFVKARCVATKETHRG